MRLFWLPIRMELSVCVLRLKTKAFAFERQNINKAIGIELANTL